MIALAFDLLLAGLILAAALAAVAGRDLFGSVVFFIVYGLLVAIAWTRLGAVDVALAEAAIGAGLTGVLLVGAAARLARARPAPADGPRWPAAVGCTAVTGLLAWAVLALGSGGGGPGDGGLGGGGLGPAVAERLDATGVGNPVTAVLLNLRAYDTLLESIVLLVALVAVWALGRDAAWGGVPGLPQRVRPDGVLATFGRALPPIGLLFGVYLVWAGAERPGGAFQGGTVLAAVWLLLALAGQAEPPTVTSRRLRLALVAGPAVFLGVGIVGALTGSFLAIPEGQAKPVILGIEAALTLSIAVTLALLVVGPPERASGAGAGR